MQSTAARPLRADAARNRQRILDAAREVFALRGIDVTLDDIARHAGLGVGTVYRRFPDREALVEALFEQRIDALVERVQIGLADPDPWRGLTELLTDLCEQLAADRGMRQVLLSSEYGLDRVAAGRSRIVPLVNELVARAGETGSLRPGFAGGDIPMLLLMLGTVADFAGDAAPEVWRRYLALFLDGMTTRRRRRAPAVPDALDDEQVAAAMSGWRPGRR